MEESRISRHTEAVKEKDVETHALRDKGKHTATVTSSDIRTDIRKLEV